MRATRGICSVWSKRSSASRVAVSRRCSSLASCAAAMERASRSVMESLANCESASFRLSSFEDEDVAVGIGDGKGCAVFYGSHSLFVEVAGGLGEVVGLKCEAGLVAESCGHDLYLLAGVAGHVQVHRVFGNGLEMELVDVEVAGACGVFHGE